MRTKKIVRLIITYTSYAYFQMHVTCLSSRISFCSWNHKGWSLVCLFSGPVFLDFYLNLKFFYFYRDKYDIYNFPIARNKTNKTVSETLQR